MLPGWLGKHVWLLAEVSWASWDEGLGPRLFGEQVEVEAENRHSPSRQSKIFCDLF